MFYLDLAHRYSELGLKPTCISFLKTKYNIDERNPSKSPCHFWRHWQVKRQSMEEINSLPWNSASGIGTVLGFDMRCIDIDNCSDESVLYEMLSILALPQTYEWAIRTPNGFHIYIKSADELPFLTNRELDEGVLALNCNEEYRKKISRIELRWANHSVLPPTKIDGYSYVFLNGTFPQTTPQSVSIYKIFRLITKYCGVYHNDIHGEIGKVKINRLLFQCSHGSHTHYPEISVFDATDIEDKLILECEPKSSIRTTIGYEDEHLVSEFAITGYESNLTPLFIDIETTGLIRDVLDHKSYPRIIQIAFTKGRDSEINSFYVRPDGFTVPQEITQLTGITNEILNGNGIKLEDVLRKFYHNDLPIVCHNTEFDISVLDVEYMRVMESFAQRNLGVFWSNPFRNGNQIYCTMKKFTQYFGGKFPKLGEMYELLFKEKPLSKMHNAVTDVEVLRDCFYLMNLYGYIKLDSKSKRIEDASKATSL